MPMGWTLARSEHPSEERCHQREDFDLGDPLCPAMEALEFEPLKAIPTNGASPVQARNRGRKVQGHDEHRQGRDGQRNQAEPCPAERPARRRAEPHGLEGRCHGRADKADLIEATEHASHGVCRMGSGNDAKD